MALMDPLRAQLPALYALTSYSFLYYYLIINYYYYYYYIYYFFNYPFKNHALNIF